MTLKKRKTLLKFDNVLSDQRQVIFSERNNVMNNKEIFSYSDNFLNEIVENFCQNVEFIIIEDDIRNVIDHFKDPKQFKIGKKISKGDTSFFKEKNFDLVFTKSTDYEKLGSTGIPDDIFDKSIDIFLKKGCIKLYAG